MKMKTFSHAVDRVRDRDFSRARVDLAHNNEYFPPSALASSAILQIFFEISWLRLNFALKTLIKQRFNKNAPRAPPTSGCDIDISTRKKKFKIITIVIHS